MKLSDVNYKIGDRVYLNSGGPEMLIVDFIELNKIIVSWYDKDGIVQESTFPIECISK